MLHNVALICNKAMWISSLVLIHFYGALYEFYTSFYMSFTCLLLYGWHDDDIAFSMFIFLQNCLNLSEIKLPPMSDIIFYGNPNSAC